MGEGLVHYTIGNTELSSVVITSTCGLTVIDRQIVLLHSLTLFISLFQRQLKSHMKMI